MAHPAVLMAARIGIRHPKRDERPILVVVKAKCRRDCSGNHPVLRRQDRQAAGTGRRAVCRFHPLGATGKMMKARLREMFKDYCFRPECQTPAARLATSDVVVRVPALCVVLAGVGNSARHCAHHVDCAAHRQGPALAECRVRPLLAFAICYLLVPSIGLNQAADLLLIGLVVALFMASFDVALGRLLPGARGPKCSRFQPGDRQLPAFRGSVADGVPVARDEGPWRLAALPWPMNRRRRCNRAAVRRAVLPAGCHAVGPLGPLAAAPGECVAILN